jgi:cytochrome P450
MTADAAKRWGMFEQEVWDNPFPTYAAVREEGGPVQRVTLYDGREAWLVTGYEAVRRALSDPRLSRDVIRYREEWPDRPPLYPEVLSKPHMLNADPPAHDRLRGLVNRVFTPRRVDGLRDRIQELADALLAAMPTHGKVDLAEAYAFPLAIQVIYDLLGVESTDGSEDLRELVMALMLHAYTPGREVEAQAARSRLDSYLGGVIEAKRAHQGEDILSALISTCDEEGDALNEEELAAFAFLLVIAGHETTVNLVCNAMVAMLRQPDQLDALRADPSLTHRAVTEFLRFDTPVHHALMRGATDDFELDGVSIAAGDLVLINLAAANRDPAHFTEPDRLDVCRDEASHVGFGHGIHYCLGSSLALLEAEIAIRSLLAHYPTILMAVPPTDIHWSRSMSIRAIEALPLEVSTAAVV